MGFCLADANAQTESPTPTVGLFALGDGDDVVTGSSWPDAVFIVAIGCEIGLIACSAGRFDIDRDVIFADRFGRQGLATADLYHESPFVVVTVKRARYDRACCSVCKFDPLLGKRRGRREHNESYRDE